MLTVEDYEKIRRAVVVEGLSQREAARTFGHSRKTIRKALEEPTPPGYRRTQPVALPVIGPFSSIIDAWLEADTHQRRKQRHTGTRIWQRLRDEYGFAGSASAVRRYIQSRRQKTSEVYFPLAFDPGEEGQVDWGEAWFELNGVPTKANLFCMRLAYSRASFVYAYPSAKLECFLDGHVRAFQFFKGVVKRCAYDNLRSAVIQVGRGRQRRLNRKFLELRCHYLFESRFCNVAAGHEKGHVENLVKLSQRTFMTPLPACTSFEDLNAHLEREYLKDLERPAPHSKQTRGALLAEERGHLLALAARRFDACVKGSTFASKQALVAIETNFYSVPVRYAHHSIKYKAFVDRIELWHEDGLVARHDRCWDRDQHVLEYLHYIPLLEIKPGGIHNARPFKGEPWGPAFERMRTELEFRYGDEGTRKFIRILLLFTAYEADDVKAAVQLCVQRRAFSDEAVKSTLDYQPHVVSATLHLSNHPLFGTSCDGIRDAREYDETLLAKEASA